METAILIAFFCQLAHLQRWLISFLALALSASYVLPPCQDSSFASNTQKLSCLVAVTEIFLPNFGNILVIVELSDIELAENIFYTIAE